MNTWWLLLMSRSRRDSATTGLGSSGYQSAGARLDVRISDFPALSVMSSYRSSAWAAVSSRMAKSSRSRTAGRGGSEGGEVADLAGRQLRGGAEVEALEGGGGLEPCAADPPVQGHAVAAGDLVLAQDLEEVQVAEVPGVRLGEAGVERAQHAGQLQGPERGCEGAAVGDGHRAHACCSLSSTWVVTRAGCPARVPADAIQAQSPNTVRCGAGAPIAAASTPTAAARSEEHTSE